MRQNVLGQSDCRTFKLIISLKQNDERLISCMLIHIHGNQKLTEKFWGGCAQKWVWLLCSLDSNFGCISKRNQWSKLFFFGVLMRIQLKAKSYFNEFWMVVFKRGCGLVGLVGSLKSAVSQEWINERSWFFLNKDANLGKLKVTLIIIGWV